jgi:acyl carrier protein
MANERLKKCFATSLGVDPDLVEGLSYKSVRQWDSVGHMALIAAIEAEFEVMLDTDEIIALSSYEVVAAILQKHGVAPS